MLRRAHHDGSQFLPDWATASRKTLEESRQVLASKGLGSPWDLGPHICCSCKGSSWHGLEFTIFSPPWAASIHPNKKCTTWTGNVSNHLDATFLFDAVQSFWCVLEFPRHSDWHSLYCASGLWFCACSIPHQAAVRLDIPKPWHQHGLWHGCVAAPWVGRPQAVTVRSHGPWWPLGFCGSWDPQTRTKPGHSSLHLRAAPTQLFSLSLSLPPSMCIYKYTYIYIYTYIYTYIYIYRYIQIYRHIQIYIYIHTYWLIYLDLLLILTQCSEFWDGKNFWHAVSM